MNILIMVIMNNIVKINIDVYYKCVCLDILLLV